MYMPPVVSGTGFEKCPEGNHLAVCYEVIDLGTQESTYDGETKRQRKIRIAWETTSEMMEDGRPFVIGRRYTLSSNENARLRKDLESWRGKKFTDEDIANFDIKSVIGAACFLNVVHTTRNEKTYANIEAVAALPKGTATPELVNERVYLSLDEDEYDVNTFNELSEYMTATIKSSPEWQKLAVSADNEAQATAGETPSDSPF